MLQYLNQKRGQSTLEYAVLIVVIIGALLTIQNYIKRGVQGRLKSASDDIGDQFSPGNQNEDRVTNRTAVTEEDFGVTGQGVSQDYTNSELTNSTKNSVVQNSTFEYWGG